MSNVRRIAIARIWHEANSFNPVLTTLDDFRRREWTKGEDALIEARDTRHRNGAGRVSQIP
jgi:microcystin degradation protein MlrC